MRYLVPGFMLCLIGCYTPMRPSLQPIRYIDVQALGEVKTEPDIADIPRFCLYSYRCWFFV